MRPPARLGCKEGKGHGQACGSPPHARGSEGPGLGSPLVQTHNAQPSHQLWHLMVQTENPPQITQALVPSHPTPLFALLQLLLQLKHPAKKGERKIFFLSYDLTPNSAGHVEKEIKKTTKYKASQGMGKKVV